MTRDEARQWLDALNGYEYRVDLRLFGGREQFAECWFAENLSGDRAQTMGFEDRFRKHAPQHPEAWFEVAFWKLFSIPPAREGVTAGVIERCQAQNPGQFWNACIAFVREESQDAFERLQNFFVAGGGLALVATFVAFAAPDCFPMVDKWVARWVRRYVDAVPNSGLLARRRNGLLGIDDWEFYRAWFRWCRSAAVVLTSLTDTHWRARDVEMAVFQSERTGAPLLPPVR